MLDGSNVDRELGRRIKRAREEAGLSQPELGDRLGVSGQTVYRWERGMISVSPERIVQLADTLGKPREYFLSSQGGDIAFHLQEGMPGDLPEAARDDYELMMDILYRKYGRMRPNQKARRKGSHPN